jgi:hypothetical protein
VRAIAPREMSRVVTYLLRHSRRCKRRDWPMGDESRRLIDGTPVPVCPTAQRRAPELVRSLIRWLTAEQPRKCLGIWLPRAVLIVGEAR